MEQLFPGLEIGRSTRSAFDAEVGADGMDLRPLPTADLDGLAAACRRDGARVAVPADAAETIAVIRAVADARSEGHPGAVHVRVDSRAVPAVYRDPPSFAFGRADRLRGGDDVTIVATGLMVAAAVVAHERLAEMGVTARVLNMASLRPLDEDAVVAGARETGALVTAEEARIDEGLGAAVAAVVQAHHPVPMEHLGLDTGAGGGADALLRSGLTAAHVMGAVHDALERKA
jgi:transketolase